MLHLLEAAPRLEHVAVTAVGEAESDTQIWTSLHGEPMHRILRAAVRWPSLQRLSLGTFEGSGMKLPDGLFPAALQAQRQRPSLCIDLCDNFFRRYFVKGAYWDAASFL